MNTKDHQTYTAIDRAIRRAAEFGQWSKILLDKTAPYGIVFMEHEGNWRVRIDGRDVVKGLTAPECFRFILDALEKKIRDNA